MIGVKSGTISSRGFRTVSCNLRTARAARGPSGRGRVAIGAGAAISRVDIGSPFGSGGAGERVARQPQVDVVEGRLAGADRAAEPEVVDGRDRLARISAMKGD